jgi:hypothetical protein
VSDRALDQRQSQLASSSKSSKASKEKAQEKQKDKVETLPLVCSTAFFTDIVLLFWFLRHGSRRLALRLPLVPLLESPCLFPSHRTLRLLLPGPPELLQTRIPVLWLRFVLFIYFSQVILRLTLFCLAFCLRPSQRSNSSSPF